MTKINLADTPEAELLAAVIARAVEDLSCDEKRFAHLKTRKHARRWMRLRKPAEDFLLQEIDEFLAFFDAASLFDEAVIRTKTRDILGYSQPLPAVIPPHKVPLTKDKFPKYEPLFKQGIKLDGTKRSLNSPHENHS